MTKVLGIDPGTHAGWAVVEDNKLLDCGPINGIVMKARPGYRYRLFYEYLGSLITHWHPDALSYEIWHHHSGTVAAEVLGGYKAIIEMVGDLRGLPLIPCEVGAIKKFATGSGAAKKDKMVLAAKRLFPQFGDRLTNENIADAVHIARLGNQLHERAGKENLKSLSVPTA
jgi:Holliday junction resolvasome RuvABC endonuclease subunit